MHPAKAPPAMGFEISELLDQFVLTLLEDEKTAE
jgi:hypothetical protein